METNQLRETGRELIRILTEKLNRCRWVKTSDLDVYKFDLYIQPNEIEIKISDSCISIIYGRGNSRVLPKRRPNCKPRFI